MKVTIKEEKPVQPPKTVVIEMSEIQARRIMKYMFYSSDAAAAFAAAVGNATATAAAADFYRSLEDAGLKSTESYS